MSARRTLSLGFALPLTLSAVVACGDDERVAPVGEGGGDVTATSTSTTTTASSSTVTTGTGGEGAGAPIRTILERNPFGNVAETANLLWDGDFEWESSFADQYGWLQGQTAALVDRHVGPECRSGIKCGVLGPDLIGLAVASAENDLYASVWIRPQSIAGQPTTCDGFSPFLLAEGIEDSGVDLPLPAVSDAPDAEGWCHFETVVPQRDDKAYLYIRSSIAGDALVDDAVVREATPEEAARVVRYAAFVPSAETAQKLASARALIRKWRGPHDGPSDAGKAVQRWGRGEGRIRLVTTPRTSGGKR